MWRKALIIITLALIVIAGISLLWIKSQSFMTTTAGVLSTEITKTLNADIKVDSVRIKSTNQIAVEGITIHTKDGEVLASAKSVDVAFSPIDIIRDKSVIQSIDKVIVNDAIVNVVQQKDGKWNYMDVLPNGETTSNDFKGKVELNHVVANLSAQGKEVTLEDMKGTLDFVSQPSVALNLSLKHKGGSLTTSGTLGGEHQALSVKAEDFNIENYLEFLPEDMAIKVLKGNLKKLDVTVLKVNGDYEFNGETIVTGASVEAQGTIIDKIDGLVLFNEKEIRVFSRGKIAEQPIVLRGTTSLDVVEPVLNLQVSSKGFDASKVLSSFPLKGEIAFNASITGKLSDPSVSGEFNVAKGTLYEYDIKNVKAQLKFFNNIVFVDEFTAGILGGTVDVHGQINTISEEYSLQAKADHVSLADITDDIPQISGNAKADVAIVGKGFDLNNMTTVYGSAGIVNGTYQGVAFETMDTSFYKQGDDITVDYLTVTLPQGKITADGSVYGNQLALNFYGSAVGIEQLASIEPKLILSGLADFSGQVTGTTNQPQIKSNFSAINGSAFYQPFKVAQGSISADANQVTIEKLELLDGVSKHEISGTVGLTGYQLVNVKISSRQARAENIVKVLLPGEDLTGNVDNDVVLTGTMDNINADGKITFNEGSFRGVLLTKAQGKYQRKNGQTEIKDFSVSSPSLNVKLKGILTANEDLDFDIVADEINVQKLRLQLPYPVSGQAKFIGKLQGNMNAPKFNGQLTANNVVFNGQTLENIDGKINFSDNVVDLTSFSFNQGKSTFNLSANTNIGTKQVQGNLEVKNGQLASILKILNIDQNWIDGTLNGNIHLEGTTDNPKVHLLGNLKEGSLKKYKLDNVDLDVFLDDKLVTITRFNAVQGDGRLVAQGKIDLAGAVDVELAGQNIEAGLLTNLADLDVDTKGVLNFGSQITGTIDNPKADISIDVQGGGIGTATFDSLYGMFILKDGTINVQQILLSKGEYKASAYGVVPLAAILKGEREQVDLKNQMDLKVSLDQADLSILPLLTKQVDWAIGPTKGGITISGTLAKPLINGAVTVTNGAVKFKQLAKPVQKMALDIQFLNDKIDLKTFEGIMGNGSFKISGTSNITGQDFVDYNFEVNLDKLDIVNKYYTGPLEGKFTLTDDRGVPKIVGNLNFEHCTVDIPLIPVSQTEMPHIRLDVDVNVGKKVRLYNSFLYDIWLEGHANFTGSTLHPRTSGEIHSTRGTISYLKTPFKVREATAYFNQVGSFLPSVSVEADTRLDRTRVYLNVNGPVDVMKFRLTSDPEMSEQEILALLTLRSHYNSKDNADSGVGRDEITSMLNIGLQMSFLSELESMLRKAIGVDELNVVRDTLSSTSSNSSLDREVYNVEIGKYINDKTMINYTAGVDHDAYKYGIRYDFNNRWSLTSNIDQDNTTVIGFEARIKF